MRMVFALASVVGMLVGGTYAIRYAGERGKMRVRCVASSKVGMEIGKEDVPTPPNAFKWWDEDNKVAGSKKGGGDKGEGREGGISGGVTDRVRGGGVPPVASGAVGEGAAVSGGGGLVLKPGNLSSGGVGVEEMSGEDAARMRQMQRQLARMRQQVRRQLEVTMRNARIPADARQDIRTFAAQLFNRIADVRRQAALGEIPRYQARQEMRAAWQEFTGYVNDRLDDEHRGKFWREWQYARNPQKRLYDMQRQMQDVQRRMKRQSRRMQELMRSPHRRNSRQGRR